MSKPNEFYILNYDVTPDSHRLAYEGTTKTRHFDTEEKALREVAHLREFPTEVYNIRLIKRRISIHDTPIDLE